MTHPRSVLRECCGWFKAIGREQAICRPMQRATGQNVEAIVSFDAARLKDMMRSRALTLAVAESLTTGRVQAAIGAVSGASEYFLGGITAYTVDQKVRHLKVNREHAIEVNAVSGRVAEEMARGVAELFGSDYSISTTGYADSTPGDAGPAPFAYVAIWRRFGGGGRIVFAGVFRGAGLSRIEMQQQVTEFVLSKLLEHLQDGGLPSFEHLEATP